MKLKALYKSIVNGLYVYGPNDMCNDALCETFEEPAEPPYEPEPEQLNWANGPVSFCFEAGDGDGLNGVLYDNGFLYGEAPQTTPAYELLDIYSGSVAFSFPGDAEFSAITVVVRDENGNVIIDAPMNRDSDFWRTGAQPNQDEIVIGNTYCLTFTTTPGDFI